MPYIRGMADFSSVTANLTYRGRTLKGLASITITGNSSRDIRVAMSKFAADNEIGVTEAKRAVSAAGLRWHHNADGTMILVERALNAEMKHTGSAALARFMTRGGKIRGLGIVGTLAGLWFVGEAASCGEGIDAVLPPTWAAETLGDSTVEGMKDSESAVIRRSYEDRYALDPSARLALLQSLRDRSAYKALMHNHLTGEDLSVPWGNFVAGDEVLDAEIEDLQSVMK
ncbi:MAG: HNH endonuclease [bacterium]